MTTKPNKSRLALVLGLAAGLLGACDSQESVKVMLPVETETTGLEPAENAEGWRVTLTADRMALRDLQLTVAGEMHGSLLRRLGDLVVGTAHAHPGHYAGGDVTGELPGKFIVDFKKGGRLGTALVIPGQYQGANFTFRRAGADDDLAAGDPLLGHSVYLEGTAEKAGRAITFRAQLDIDDGAQLVGAPCNVLVTESGGATLALQAENYEPVRKDALFDGVDFASYDPEGDGQVDIMPGSEAHNILRRTIQVHDFYNVISR